MPDLMGAPLTNYRKFLGSCLLLQFSLSCMIGLFIVLPALPAVFDSGKEVDRSNRINLALRTSILPRYSLERDTRGKSAVTFFEGLGLPFRPW